MCDSLLCTIAVVVPVVTALIVYRNDVRQLLKILFVGFLLFGAFVSSRHLFFRAARQLRNYLWGRHPQEEEAEGKFGEKENMLVWQRLWWALFGVTTLLACQVVVTYISPVEAFVTGIKVFDRPNVCLIA